MGSHRRKGVAALLGLVLAVTACTQQRETTGERASSGPASSGAPRILTLAVPREPDTWNTDITLVTRGGGTSTVGYIGHQKLVVQNDNQSYVPEVAVEQISVEKGTWRINPDGSMDVTWRIRPNVQWHDGMPFTAADLMFTFSVIKDAEIPNVIGAPLRLMQSASAPDPHTFVIHWSGPYVDADQAPGLTLMPRHLLEEAFRTDKAAFPNHPWMTTEFVGLGPYRLVRWESGVLLEFARFEGYYKGRPPLDTVYVRLISDETTMVAAILAGQLDVLPPVGIDLDTAVDVRRRWEGTGNTVGGKLSGGFLIVEMQHRPEYARPTVGLRHTPVRQAFYQAIDRSQMAEVMNHGLAPPADSWFFPGHELRAQVESSIPQFPYDTRRSTELLGQAGWSRGADGILLHQPSGERFEVQIGGTRGDEKLLAIVADSWRAIGAQVEELAIGSDRARDLEFLARLPGGWITTPRFYQLYTDRYHSQSAPTAATRWTGRNRGGYSNPTVDGLLDRLVVTVSANERLSLHRELLKEQGGDLAIMPLYWEYDPFFITKGVTGVATGGAWNFFEWGKE